MNGPVLRRRRLTLRQLAKRLADIVEQNTKAGWDERNDLPVAVRVNRRASASRRVSDHFYVGVEYADSSQMGLGEHGEFCGTINVDCRDLVKL